MKIISRSVFLSVIALFLIYPQAQAEVRSASTSYEKFIQSLRVIPQGLNQHQLKVFLLDQYFEVYAFYSELPESKQAQVYEFYSSLESAEISDIDTRIRELM